MPKNIFASFTFKMDQFQTMDIFLLLLLDGKPNYIVLAPGEPGKLKVWFFAGSLLWFIDKLPSISKNDFHTYFL